MKCARGMEDISGKWRSQKHHVDHVVERVLNVHCASYGTLRYITDQKIFYDSAVCAAIPHDGLSRALAVIRPSAVVQVCATLYVHLLHECMLRCTGIIKESSFLIS